MTENERALFLLLDIIEVPDMRKQMRDEDLRWLLRNVAINNEDDIVSAVVNLVFKVVGER